MKRFDMIGDARMKPIENGDWIAYDDAHLKSIKSAIETVLEKKDALDSVSPGGIVYCGNDDALRLLACAIEDLRSAYNAG